MPEYDHDHAMTLTEYLSVLDPFLVFVTMVMVVCVVLLASQVIDLVIRVLMKEKV